MERFQFIPLGSILLCMQEENICKMILRESKTVSNSILETLKLLETKMHT